MIFELFNECIATHPDGWQCQRELDHDGHEKPRNRRERRALESIKRRQGKR